MERMDEGMPFILKYENVAWYEGGIVRILDRRALPELRFVECRDYREVARAIADMVTQSAGPYTAVGMGMALAAHQSRSMAAAERKEFLRQAALELANSRPTAANRYAKITLRCAELGCAAVDSGEDAAEAVRLDTVASLNRRYSAMQRAGDALERLIPENGTVLTQCYGETIIGALIRAAKRTGKVFRVFCAETRPYLQGARLTAGCFAESGFDTAVLTDNMIAWAMENEGIDVFTSAADTITRDGHIANKVGTFQLAILAKHFGVPYYVTGIPDEDKLTRGDIVIEFRDPSQVLSFRGIPTAAPNVKALYPAFDITPPDLISGVVTDRGVFAPDKLSLYFEAGEAKFY